MQSIPFFALANQNCQYNIHNTEIQAIINMEFETKKFVVKTTAVSSTGNTVRLKMPMK